MPHRAPLRLQVGLSRNAPHAADSEVDHEVRNALACLPKSGTHACLRPR